MKEHVYSVFGRCVGQASWLWLKQGHVYGTSPTRRGWRVQGLKLGCLGLTHKFYCYVFLFQHYEFQFFIIYLLVYPWAHYLNLLNLSFNYKMGISNRICFLGLWGCSGIITWSPRIMPGTRASLIKIGRDDLYCISVLSIVCMYCLPWSLNL